MGANGDSKDRRYLDEPIESKEKYEVFSFKQGLSNNDNKQVTKGQSGYFDKSQRCSEYLIAILQTFLAVLRLMSGSVTTKSFAK